jgi:hypothetical protein
VVVEPATFPAAFFVAANLRTEDAREINATREDESPDLLARDVCLRSPYAWVVGAEYPIACIGVSRLWPGVWDAWMFATDDFLRIGLPLTRWVRRTMMPLVKAAGAHRVHCRSIEGHTEAHAWLERLGAVREGALPGWGKERETFFVYRWGGG